MRKIRILAAALLFTAFAQSVNAQLFVDTNGDGVTDTVSATGFVVKILHPNTGITNSYTVGAGFSYFEVVGATDTNGQAGQEVVVRTNSSGGIVIHVIDDVRKVIRRYTVGAGIGVTFFAIVSIRNDTSGAAGNEVVVQVNDSTGAYIKTVDDVGGTVRGYPVAGVGTTFFAIVGIGNTNGLAGDEIVMQVNGGGTSSLRILDDARRITRTYPVAGVGTTFFEIVQIIDTDGRTGSEIVMRIAGSVSMNINILDDARGVIRTYPVAGQGTTLFAIQGIRDYDGIAGAEVCYRVASSTSNAFRMIVDRTQSIVGRSGC